MYAGYSGNAFNVENTREQHERDKSHSHKNIHFTLCICSVCDKKKIHLEHLHIASNKGYGIFSFPFFHN